MKVVPKTALRIAMAPTGHFLKTWFLNYHPPFSWFCLPWWSTKCLVPTKDTSFQFLRCLLRSRQSPNKGVVTIAFLPGWLLEPHSLLSAATQWCFPRSADFTCFQIGNAYLKHSILANGKHPFASGTVGMNCQSLHIFSVRHLFATIRFYCYPILIQGQN